MEQNQDIASSETTSDQTSSATAAAASSPPAPSTPSSPSAASKEDALSALAVATTSASSATAVADEQTARVPVVASVRRSLAAPRWVWLRLPEFWLAIILAAFLRLWHIDLTQFLDDQTFLMQLARGAWLHGALPVTGIPSSIGTLNPPISVYLLAPFVHTGKDPLPAAISIAVWNVLGVALCYIFARRYFGRVVAASGALLFASCGAAVNYSRFIWQQNYLPPVLALWILTLYLGCVSGRRRWFVPHVALLTIAILLHPSVALLIPVSLIGLALTPRRAMPSRWEWIIAAALVLLLLAPTIVWETISSGSDIRLFAHYLAHRGSFNLDVLRMLYAALGAPAASDFGANTAYAQWGPLYPLLNAAAVLCFVAGMAVLTERLLRVGIYIWREGAATATPAAGRRARLRGRVRAVWRGLHDEAAWRAHLLLWLWVVVPVALMLRHAGPLYVHYLMILYPAAFIASGFAVQAVYRRASRLIPQAIPQQTLRAAILTLLVLLVAAQALQSALYPATLASGSFAALTGYGYPLAEVQQLDAALGTLQTEQDAHTIFLSLPRDTRYRAPLDYLTISEHPDRTGSAANCLVLPAPDEEPSLIVATLPAGPANTMLTTLPELTLVANLDMAGSDDDFAVYQLKGTVPPLLGERPLAPTTIADAAGNGLRLDAVALQSDGQIRLRWTVLGSATTGSGTPWYRISPAIRALDGSTRALPGTDCQPTRWHAGETVFTWVSTGATGNASAAVTTETLLLQVRGGTHLPTTPTVGPLRLLSAQPSGAPLGLLRPASGTVTPDGSLAVPLTTSP